jgi:hypothetical protein
VAEAAAGAAANGAAPQPPAALSGANGGGEEGAGHAATLWSSLDEAYRGFAPFRDAALDRWHRKTALTTGGASDLWRVRFWCAWDCALLRCKPLSPDVLPMGGRSAGAKAVPAGPQALFPQQPPLPPVALTAPPRLCHATGGASLRSGQLRALNQSVSTQVAMLMQVRWLSGGSGLMQLLWFAALLLPQAAAEPRLLLCRYGTP